MDILVKMHANWNLGGSTDCDSRDYNNKPRTTYSQHWVRLKIHDRKMQDQGRLRRYVH